MAILTRDQLSALNFGYITGMNLLQFCPDQLLIKAYADSPDLFQLGINEAIGDIKSRLSSLYDFSKVFGTLNQLFYSQSGSLNITIAALTYVERIYFTQSADSINASGLIDSVISIGTTSGGNDLLDSMPVCLNGNLWFINQYFASASTLYATISGPDVDVQLIASKQPSGNITSSQAFINNLTKDDYLMKIVSILAVENILGSMAATNKQLQGLFERNELAIQRIEAKQRSLSLPVAPRPIAGVPETINSNFKTTG